VRFTGRIKRGLGGASAALATTDGRWALVSTSMTALVAGAIAWMAMGVVPLDRPMVAPGRSSLPYALFMKLIRASEPQITNDNADNANPNPGVESRTVTLDAGDTWRACWKMSASRRRTPMPWSPPWARISMPAR
jgi:hypothetical protein